MPPQISCHASRPDCAWCGARFADGTRRLRGRTLCSACGVATTDPWPTADGLERAYSTWYRPPGGRFSGVGDALLTRSRGLLARRSALGPRRRLAILAAATGLLPAAAAAALEVAMRRGGSVYVEARRA